MLTPFDNVLILSSFTTIFFRLSKMPGNPGNLLELFFFLEIREILWKFARSPINFLAEFMCLLLL